MQPYAVRSLRRGVQFLDYLSNLKTITLLRWLAPPLIAPNPGDCQARVSGIP